MAETYHPRVISWNVTAGCHLRCAHCYLAAGRRGQDELSTNEGLRLIDQMAEAGTELLILTGGEPMLRRDLGLLARHATDRGIAVVLGTTGTLMTEVKAKELKDSGVIGVGISIDSLDPDLHDGFRGVPGAWERAVAGIAHCRAAGLEVLLHATALPMNYHSIPEMVRFAHEQGARAFHLFFLVCTGRGEGLTDLTPQQYETALSSLLEAEKEYPDLVVRARCAPFIQRLAEERDVDHWAAGCLAGTSYCRITPNGDVTPCPYMPLRAGNVRDASLGEIWETAPVLRQFRSPRLTGACGDCALAQGDNPLCVGCRARAFALKGNPLESDPWCLRGPLREAAPVQMTPEWTPEAIERLSRIPGFIRGRVQRAIEAHARKQGLARITPSTLEEMRRSAYVPRGGHGGPPRPT